jgi:hypothetical protein
VCAVLPERLKNLPFYSPLYLVTNYLVCVRKQLWPLKLKTRVPR